METIPYLVCNEMIPMSLDLLYANDLKTINDLKYTLSAIINTEAPITLNLIKKRLRDAFGVKKISDKALAIVLKCLNEFPSTYNLYDSVYWPEDGKFMPKFIRVGYEREIYDVAYQEMAILVSKLMNDGLSGDDLYRNVLSFFGFSVLTKKAKDYLEFVVKMVEKC